MIEGGWVCRACWKPNGPRDDRCYRCKTPRDEQLAVEAGSLKETSAPGYGLRGRMDIEFGILAALVSWPMALSGWLAVIFGVLLGVLSILAVLTGGEDAVAILVVAAVASLVFGSLWIFLSRSVRRNARWAYAIAAVAYLLPSLPSLLGLVDLPPEALANLPDSYLTVQTVLAIIYLLLGISAVFLLIISFIRQDQGG